MPNNTGRRARHIVLGALECALASTAYAQSSPGVPGQAGNSTDGAVLQEIVVTAQRRLENRQDVPISVVALDASKLAASGVQSTQELSTLVSGLILPSDTGYTQPHIRGVGNTTVEAGIENSVALYVDGVYYGTPAGSTLSLNNVSQIEVLKGPQGTLFGRNATGGLIQVITKDPTIDPHVEASVSYGNYNTVSLSSYLSGGVTNNYAADLAVQATHQGDGFGINLYNGEQVYRDDRDLSLRSKQLWTPTDSTKVKLALDYENRLTADPMKVVPGTLAQNVFYAGNSAAIRTSGNDFDVDQDTPAVQDLQSGGAALTFDQDLGFAHLLDIAAYRREHFRFRLDLDLGPQPLQDVLSNQDDEQFSDELQLQSNGRGPLQWTAGLYYLHMKDAYTPIEVSFGGAFAPPLGPGFALTNVRTDTAQKTDSVAGYAQATYDLTEVNRLTLGARYTYEKKSMTGSETGVGNGVVDLPFGVFDVGMHTTKPSWRVSFDHKFSATVMAYVSYNRGFKSGGFNLSLPTSPPFQPETLDAYELGLKTTSLQDRLRVNTAVFYYDYKNIQVARFSAGTPQVYNGAAARLYGIDLDAEAALTKSLTLGLTLEGLHSEFTSFPCADHFDGGPNLSAPGCSDATSPQSPYERSAKGNSVPDAPNFTTSVSLEDRFALWGGDSLLHVDESVNSGYYPDPGNELRQPAFNVLNASWQLSTVDDRKYVRLWGKNLADTRYSYKLATSNIQYGTTYAPPRTYGITVGFKF